MHMFVHIHIYTCTDENGRIKTVSFNGLNYREVIATYGVKGTSTTSNNTIEVTFFFNSLAIFFTRGFTYKVSQ